MLPPIQHAVYIAAEPKRVFKTLTTSNGWDAWFTNGTVIDARVGGWIQFRWVNWGPNHITMEDGGPIIDVVPDKSLVFQWKPGDSVTTIRIDLEPRGDGTVILLTESGYQSPNGYAECATGWGEALTLLKFYLEHGITYGEIPLPQVCH